MMTMHWLKARRRVLGLAGALVSTVCPSPSLHAGIIYDLSPLNATVNPSGTVSIPIVVSSTQSSLNWVNAGFTLTWNSSVLNLQATPYSLTGSPLAGTGVTPPVFVTSTPGQLIFTWFDQTSADLGIAVPDGTTLFTVNFQAVGNSGSSTALSATDVAPIVFADFTSTQPSFPPGSVTIVPEPINWALGSFACLFIGGAILTPQRWRPRRLTA
jgi:hypothetical protein